MDLLSRKTDGEIGSVSRELPACGLDGGIDLLLGGRDDLAPVFLGGCLDASLFGSALSLSGVAHHSDFDIELLQARLDFSQLAACFFAGLLRFLHGSLNGGRAVAEDTRKELAACPDDCRANYCEVQHEAEPIRRLHADMQLFSDPRH